MPLARALVSALAVTAAAAASGGAPAAAAPPSPAPCCAYGGTGAAIALGVGSFAFPGAKAGAPTLTTLAIGTSGSAVAAGGVPFVAVVLGAKTGPEDAVAGWSVSQPNASGQLIRAYARDGGDGTPVCIQSFAPASTPAVPGFDLCGGAGGAGNAPLFPEPARAYALAGVNAGVFFQPPSGATLSLLTGAATCDVLGLAVPSSPFGTGAWTAAFESGQPASPPEAWAEFPSWCA